VDSKHSFGGIEIDPKSMIFGSVISILLFTTSAFAYQNYFKVRLDVNVPTKGYELRNVSGGLIEEGDLKAELSLNHTVNRFTIENTGSKDLIMRFTCEAPKELEIKIFVTPPYGSNKYRFEWVGALNLPRGEKYMVEILVVDKGIEPGNYVVNLTFEVD
jgi:hypothetical protein